MLEYSFTREAIDEPRPMIQKTVDDAVENLKRKGSGGQKGIL
jgi:hypothetical protein